jgi:hypothetical protein
MSRRTNGLSSAKNSQEAHREGGLRHTRPKRAIPWDQPPEWARSGPVSRGEKPGTGPDHAKPPPCGVPVAEERRLAAVSPLSEVMGPTGDDHTRESGHDRSLSPAERPAMN